MRTNFDLSIPGTNVRLGDRVKDPVTGFVGIVTTHQRHLSGCDTIWLTGSMDEKGNKIERCVDVLLVELVESNPLKATPIPKEVPPAG